MKSTVYYLSVILLVVAGCKSPQEKVSTLEEKVWGESGGKLVKLFTLTNRNGMTIKITTYGGTLTSVSVPDKNGVFENVVLGFDSLRQYLGDHPFFGVIVGRYANRIAKARFALDGNTYTLSANDGINTLHGGPTGFQKRVFDVDTTYSSEDSSVLVLSYTSADLEEGYPGNLKARVTYTLTGNDEIKIAYEAETDKPTVVNLTNHSYFNLTACKENILNHEVVLMADSITPTDSALIPTGILAPVAGTAFDFTSAHKIGERIDQVPGGYDINYKLRGTTGQLAPAAEVYEPASGRLLQVYTTEPGIQFYTGNFLNGTITGFHGVVYEKHYGFCLETQHFPDSPNQPLFPTTLLRPGEKYRHLTVYRFSLRQ